MRTPVARRRPGRPSVASALALVCLTIGQLCSGQTVSVPMLLQPTPTDGGDILPGLGVHRFALDTPVTLTALPKEGYQFLYWLGDVGDPASSRTVTFSDRPKIIVAVFQQSAMDVRAPARRSGGGGGGSGRSGGGRSWSSSGLVASVTDFYVPSGVSVGAPSSALRRAAEQSDGSGSIIIPIPSPGDDEPGGGGGGPPIPEPATSVLLLAGGAVVLRVCRRRRYV